MPITPKIKFEISVIIVTLNIPGIAIPNDLIDILRPSFLEITLIGLSTFKSLINLITLRFDELIVRDINDIKAIRKSVIFHLFLM